MTLPWVFAVLGVGLVIASAVLSGFYTSHLEGAEARVQRKVRELEEKIAWCRDRLASGSQKLSSAELKLVLLRSTQPPTQVLSRQLKEISNDILRGIADRNSAATGDDPSDQQMQAWMTLAGRAGGGDASAFSDLSVISSGLLEAWAHHNDELVKRKDEHKGHGEHLRKRVSQVRFVAVAVQILGLTLVLMKDLPR